MDSIAIWNKCGVFGIVESKTTLARTSEIQNAMCPRWRVVTNALPTARSRIWLIWDPNKVDIVVDEIHSQFIHVKVL